MASRHNTHAGIAMGQAAELLTANTRLQETEHRAPWHHVNDEADLSFQLTEEPQPSWQNNDSPAADAAAASYQPPPPLTTGTRIVVQQFDDQNDDYETVHMNIESRKRVPRNANVRSNTRRPGNNRSL